MIFFANSQGTIDSVISSPVYQGSNLASEIILVAPLSSDLQVTAKFILPNGITTTEQFMTAQSTQIFDKNNNELNAWLMLLPFEITEFSGQITVQFSIYTGTQILTTTGSMFEVLKGVPINLPEVPTENIYQQILQYLASFDGSLLNIENGDGLGSLQQYLIEDNTRKGSNAYGKYAVALNQNNKSYQRASFSTGGGNEVGLTEEEFNALYGQGGIDIHGLTYDKSNSYANVGGETNKVKARGSHIGGGRANEIKPQAEYSGIVAGGGNKISSRYSGILGGYNNEISSINAENIGILDGYGNVISGSNSGAGGENNTIEVLNTHAFGKNLKAPSGYGHNKFLVGQFNDDKSYALFQVGNGNNEEDRKNAFEVFSNGSVQVHKAPQYDDEVVRLKELNEKVSSKLMEINEHQTIRDGNYMMIITAVSSGDNYIDFYEPYNYKIDSATWNLSLNDILVITKQGNNLHMMKFHDGDNPTTKTVNHVSYFVSTTGSCLLTTL